MNHKFMSNCSQAFLSPAYFLSAAVTAVILLISCLEQLITAYRTVYAGELLEYGFHGNLILTAISSDTALMAFPVIAALPFTASYIDDVKSGFVKEYLPRAGRSSYITGKLLACMASGGSVFILGILLCYGLLVLVLTPMEATLTPDLENPQYFLQLLRQCGLLFCSGSFWSLTGLTLSAATNSKYMAYASPFIFYYILIILHERYFRNLYIFYPREWLFPSENWPLGNWSAALWLLELSALCSLYFYILAERRLTKL